ncbi:MAG: DUF4173 domain-containing protein, partial [Oscillospiraceae bacterium]|nr:DUF4173 domain-containing protein [Oscillospiraceae bacterium]
EGFFELCAVAVINALMILIATLFVRRRRPGAPLVRTYVSVYSVFTLILIATALSKMLLYIDVFGLTRLRVLTSVFMLALALCFLAVLVKQFVRRLPLVGVVAAVAVIALAGVSLCDLDGAVSDYNVGAYLAGRIADPDVDLLQETGEGAVPALLRLSTDGRTSPRLRSRAGAALRGIASDLSEPATIWSWSLPRARAVAALRRGGYLTESGTLAPQIAEDGSAVLSVSLSSDDKIYGVSCAFSIDGRLVSSQGAECADGSPLDSPVRFDILPEDLGGAAPGTVFTVALSVQTEPDGPLYEVPGRLVMKLDQSAAVTEAVLSGDRSSGFKLQTAFPYSGH